MRLWIQFKNRRKTARPLMLRQTEAKKFRKISRFRLFSAFRGFGTCQPPFAYLKMSALLRGCGRFPAAESGRMGAVHSSSIGIAYTGVYAWLLPAAEEPALI